mmetsp:Transcript_35083/g.76611  ORF Transcript_35083/g.76611 Transcript_35083/m.76611 type:complete len:254 (+) Transcript_35083:506-1267(+)
MESSWAEMCFWIREATSSSTLLTAFVRACTSFSTVPKSAGRKMVSIAMACMSGKASSARLAAVFETSLEICCFAAATACTFSKTTACRCLSSLCLATTVCVSCHLLDSSSTWSSQSFIMAFCRTYHFSLKSLILSISTSSMVSMRDCSRVLFTKTSRIGSTSSSKMKSSPSSTCVDASTPTLCGWRCSGGGSGRNSSVCASTVSTLTGSSLAVKCFARSASTRSFSGSGKEKMDSSFGRRFLRGAGELDWTTF